MAFIIKTLAFLAALFSFIVSALDLLERVGVDVYAWLASAPDPVTAVPQAYSNWVDGVATRPEVANLSSDMSEMAPGASPAETFSAMPTIISGAILAVAALFLLFVVPRFFRR